MRRILLLAEWATPTGRGPCGTGGASGASRFCRSALEEVTSNLSKAEARDALAAVSYLLSS